MFLYLLNISLPFILIRLCLERPFCRPDICGSSLLWKFFPVGGVGQVAYQGFLIREACICVLVVDLDLFSLSAVNCPIVSFEVSMGFL